MESRLGQEDKRLDTEFKDEDRNWWSCDVWPYHDLLENFVITEQKVIDPLKKKKDKTQNIIRCNHRNYVA